VETFLKAARKGRHGIRNFAMLLLAYRHGLRVSELVNMRVADVDLDTGRLFVCRCKGSLSTSQPLDGVEIRALRGWLRQRINTCVRTIFSQNPKEFRQETAHETKDEIASLL
jgi:integrase